MLWWVATHLFDLFQANCQHLSGMIGQRSLDALLGVAMNTLNEEVRKAFHPTAKIMRFDKKPDLNRKWAKALNEFTVCPIMADLMGLAAGLNKSPGPFGHRGHNGVALCGYNRDCRAGHRISSIFYMNNPINKLDDSDSDIISQHCFDFVQGSPTTNLFLGDHRKQRHQGLWQRPFEGFFHLPGCKGHHE